MGMGAVLWHSLSIDGPVLIFVLVYHIVGLIKVQDWCDVMTEVMQMDQIPWRSLQPQLVARNEDNGLVEYLSTFDIKVTNRYEEVRNIENTGHFPLAA